MRRPFFLPSGNPHSVPNEKSEFDTHEPRMKRGVIWERAFKRDDTK